jgi:hypothetical protein
LRGNGNLWRSFDECKTFSLVSLGTVRALYAIAPNPSNPAALLGQVEEY